MTDYDFTVPTFDTADFDFGIEDIEDVDIGDMPDFSIEGAVVGGGAVDEDDSKPSSKKDKKDKKAKKKGFLEESSSSEEESGSEEEEESSSGEYETESEESEEKAPSKKSKAIEPTEEEAAGREIITVTVDKPPGSKVGLTTAEKNGKLVVTKVKEGGLLDGSRIGEGMEIFSINGIKVTEKAAASKIFADTTGDLTIVAFGPADEPKAEEATTPDLPAGGGTDLPGLDLDVIPDISEPNFDYDFTVPDFDDPAAAAAATEDSAVENVEEEKPKEDKSKGSSKSTSKKSKGKESSSEKEEESSSGEYESSSEEAPAKPEDEGPTEEEASGREIINVMVDKPPGSKVGLTTAEKKGKLVVTKVKEGGLLDGSEIGEGMEIFSINGIKVTEKAAASKIFADTTGLLTIVAFSPRDDQTNEGPALTEGDSSKADSRSTAKSKSSSKGKASKEAAGRDIVTVTVDKPPASKVGLTTSEKEGKLVVTKVKEGGLLDGTEIGEGMEIFSINDIEVTEKAAASKIFADTTGLLTIVAFSPPDDQTNEWLVQAGDDSSKTGSKSTTKSKSSSKEKASKEAAGREIVTVTVDKPPASKVGLTTSEKEGKLVVTKVKEGGLLDGTEIGEGMEIFSINDIEVTEKAAASKIFADTTGLLTIVAFAPPVEQEVFDIDVDEILDTEEEQAESSEEAPSKKSKAKDKDKEAKKEEKSKASSKSTSRKSKAKEASSEEEESSTEVTSSKKSKAKAADKPKAKEAKIEEKPLKKKYESDSKSTKGKKTEDSTKGSSKKKASKGDSSDDDTSRIKDSKSSKGKKKTKEGDSDDEGSKIKDAKAAKGASKKKTKDETSDDETSKIEDRKAAKRAAKKTKNKNKTKEESSDEELSKGKRKKSSKRKAEESYEEDESASWSTFWDRKSKAKSKKAAESSSEEETHATRKSKEKKAKRRSKKAAESSSEDETYTTKKSKEKKAKRKTKKAAESSSEEDTYTTKKSKEKKAKRKSKKATDDTSSREERKTKKKAKRRSDDSFLSDRSDPSLQTDSYGSYSRRYRRASEVAPRGKEPPAFKFSEDTSLSTTVLEPQGPIPQTPTHAPMQQTLMHGPTQQPMMNQSPMHAPTQQQQQQQLMQQSPMYDPTQQAQMQQSPMYDPTQQQLMQQTPMQAPVQALVQPTLTHAPMQQSPMHPNFAHGPTQQAPMQGPMMHQGLTQQQFLGLAPPQGPLMNVPEVSEYSFPRIPKQPKKPKRNQEDIPKQLYLEIGGDKGGDKGAGDKRGRQKREDQPKPPFPPKVEGSNNSARSDVARLLFDYVAELDTDTVDRALTDLSQAFLRSHQKAKEAVDLGGHGIIVVTMKKWIYNKKIQQLGCECIHNIVYNYKENRIDIFEALAVMGALEQIVVSMDKYPESVGVQRFGLAALGNLLYGRGKELRARAQKIMDDFDAFTTVVGAMRRFPANTMVQGCGCIVLTAFLRAGKDFEATKLKLIEAGAVLDVAAAVTHQSKNPLIQKEASNFMKAFFGWNRSGGNRPGGNRVGGNRGGGNRK